MTKMQYSGNSHNYMLSYEDEDEIRNLIMYRKIVKVDNRTDTLWLDNGTTLEIIPNEGCGGCSNGWYSITEINDCDNAITNVEFGNKCDESFSIFVYAENKRIKILQVEGIDNGYYGCGYKVRVKVPRQKEQNVPYEEERDT